ncbi:hypothetical protein [Fusibacter sp. 3D3]|uniref:hypothetical protein n=1 Tax=Fusibacter sp. 3D3 TaxID=1048380 RepID=UPI000853602D|nr:hypothetical protein [Fusibacter sp. 3D3]GAU79310.1 hypothetical protein F3D3_3969 [Fusibacter sp. 3D3]
MRKNSIFETLPYIIGIAISGYLTLQFGYFVYRLNFTGHLGDSFTTGMIGSGAVTTYISENMPIVFLILFIVMFIVTVVLSKCFISTLKSK